MVFCFTFVRPVCGGIRAMIFFLCAAVGETCRAIENAKWSNSVFMYASVHIEYGWMYANGWPYSFDMRHLWYVIVVVVVVVVVFLILAQSNAIRFPFICCGHFIVCSLGGDINQYTIGAMFMVYI